MLTAGSHHNPLVSASALTVMPDCYKIKLRSAGFRLVYQVMDDKLTIAVGICDTLGLPVQTITPDGETRDNLTDW